MLETPQSQTRKISWTRVVTYFIVIVGTLLNLLFIVPNGDYSCQQGVCGIRIGEWHYHDALWHIAVARNSFSSFPFVFPSAAGFALTSYNYLLGAILFLFEKLWINPFFTYFKVLPIVGNIALIYTLFRYFRLTHKTETQILWITFFMYFGSSFSFLLILYRNNFAEFSILKGFPVVATLQPAFVTSNIQFFLTIPILLFILTNIFQISISRKMIILQCILLALTVGLKLYSAILVLVLLLIGTLVHRNSRNIWRTILLTSLLYLVVFIVSTCILYLPFGKDGVGIPFVWSPVSIPHVITESPGLFYHKDFTLGRYFMYGLQRVSPRLIFYELISISIFLLLNLGSRFVGLLGITIDVIRRKLNLESALLAITGSLCMLLPTLFIQKGGGWYNTIQFAYIGIYFMGILAGLTIARLWNSHRILLRLIVCIAIILTIPNNILTLKLIAKPKELIPAQELQALSILRRQPMGIVLSFPDYKNSSYVPALSGKVGYMIDYEQAALLSLPTERMIKEVESRECSVLDKVDYVYLNSPQGAEFASCPTYKTEFKQIYRSGSISIRKKI